MPEDIPEAVYISKITVDVVASDGQRFIDTFTNPTKTEVSFLDDLDEDLGLYRDPYKFHASQRRYILEVALGMEFPMIRQVMKSPPEGRPSVERWGVGMAEAASTRAECTRRKVGAIVLDRDGRIVGAGYNGAPAGKPSCLDGACPRAFSGVAPGSSYDTGAGSCIAIHAEANALLDAGRLSRGGQLMVSSAICDGCLRLAKGARIAWVHCAKPNGEIDSIPIR
jgi:dCMP deaminase